MSPDLVLAHHKLHYLDENTHAPRPVLLLHGLGATSDSWYFQFPALTDAGFRILAPDARGFGKSTYPGYTSIPAMADDVFRLLNFLQIERTDVVGISMGGVMALQLALDHPKMIDHLVLVNTFASLRPRSLKVWAYFIYRFILVHRVGLNSQALFVARRIFPKPEQEVLRQELVAQINQASPKGYRATMRALGLLDIAHRLGEIKSPTLVITGERDGTVPPDVQSALARKIPGAVQSFIPEAGHAVSVELPEKFNRVMVDFLSDRI